jgi:hypothetical protein
MFNDEKRLIGKISMRANALEDIICALIRNINPEEREPIVFSKIALEFKSISGYRFTEFFQVKPGDFALEYKGSKLRFSRDHNTPPLLQCARIKGPWLPIPAPSESLLQWARENSSKAFEEVDFADAGRRMGDSDAAILAWFRFKSILQTSATGREKNISVGHRVSMEGFYVRPPNSTCTIGSIHTGVYHHIAENGKGIVVVFNGQMDADITAYLPISSFPGGTDINSLISRTDRFVIIGRKDPDKILLNLAPKSDFPPMKMGRLQETIARVSEIESEVMRLKEMLLSVDESRVIEALPLAERVFAMSLGRIVAKASMSWNCRGLTDVEIIQRGASVYNSPQELSTPSAIDENSEIPYAAVIQTIRALRQNI